MSKNIHTIYTKIYTDNIYKQHIQTTYTDNIYKNICNKYIQET